MYHRVRLRENGKPGSVPVRSDHRIVSNFDVVARHRASRFTSVVASSTPRRCSGVTAVPRLPDFRGSVFLSERTHRASTRIVRRRLTWCTLELDSERSNSSS